MTHVGETLTNIFSDLSDDHKFGKRSQFYKDYQEIIQEIRSGYQ